MHPYLMKNRSLFYTTQFKKDLKKYRNDRKKRIKIVEVISLLAEGKQIPQEMRPHKLIGNYEGCMELQIEGGFAFDMDRKDKSA